MKFDKTEIIFIKNGLELYKKSLGAVMKKSKELGVNEEDIKKSYLKLNQLITQFDKEDE